MATPTQPPLLTETLISEIEVASPTSASAVSWGAIFAGALSAAALSLVLLILGTGLGLSSVSPWSNDGIGAGALGISTIVWITITQLVAAGAGGYLAGRLRTRWTGLHGDEVYFRDTAHGFLAWCVATLLSATLLASAVGTILHAGAQAGGLLAGSAATAAAAGGGAVADKANTEQRGPKVVDQPFGYAVDSLFRREPNAGFSEPMTAPPATASTPEEADARVLAEVTRIYANGIANGALPPEDTQYLGQLVAQRTGLSQQDAEKRVNDNFQALQTKLKQAETAARDAADKARKASAYTALWLVVSLLIGAFIASFAATLGGRQRDA